MRQRILSVIRSIGQPGTYGYPGIVALVLAWAFVGTLAYARHYVQDPNRALDATVLPHYLETLTCYVSWGLMSVMVFRAERRLPLGRPGWARHLAVLAGLSIPMVYAASAISFALGTAVHAVFGQATPSYWFWPAPPRLLLGHQFLFWSSVIAGWMLRALAEARENERQTASLMLEKSQLETSLRQAELDVLRMRLDPHFLFNSLQNISVLTLHDPQTSSRMLTRLGDLLRVALRRDARPETRLDAEVALTTAYLAIEQMRFGDRLSSLVDLEPGTEAALVPTFLLQPLVENAIRHGLRHVREDGVIVIRSRISDGSLVLTVTDNGAGLPEEPKDLGIGLGATCERLARMYPGAHAFSLRPVPEGGTEVRIELPLRLEAPTEIQEHGYAAPVDRR